MGAELVEGDLKDAASLARACAGVEAVISTASSTLSRQAGDSIASVDEQGQLALVDAARTAGATRFVFVSFRAHLDQPEARHAVIEIGGPQALSPNEVIRMCEAAGLGELTVERVPVAALEAQLLAADEPLQQSFAGLMLQYAAGDVIDATRASRLSPFQRTSVRDFIIARLQHG